MKKTFHYTVLFLNSFALLGISFSLISPFINPNIFWPISFFGLFFPIFAITIFLFSIFWFFHNKRYMWFNLILLIISTPYISRFLSFNYPQNTTNKDINIMSYNVRLFNKWKWIDIKNVDEKIINFVNKEEIDIFCIQEYYNPKKDLNFNFKYSHIGIQKSTKEWHMAIYSNFPQINKETVMIDGERMNNTCIFSDIIINTDTIRIYNIHLASNFFNQNDIRFMSSPELKQEKIKRGIFGVTKRLKKSFEARGKEVRQIKKHIDSSPYPSIICGDFNDTPVSYAYKELIENKVDGFIDSGNGIGATFTKIPLLRIDYILFDEKFSSSNFITHQEILSDHRAISCKIKID